MKMSFSKKPVDDATLLTLHDKKMKDLILKKISSYLYAFGHSTTNAEYIYYDFVAYMSDEDKVFKPDLYMNESFKEYKITPYILKRLECYLISVGSDLANKLKFEYNFDDSLDSEDKKPSYPNCISTNLVGELDSSVEQIELDSEIPDLVSQAAYVKSEYGIDIVSYLKAESGIGAGKEKDEVLLSENIPEEVYEITKRLVSGNVPEFAPETGYGKPVLSYLDQIDFLEYLTGQNVGFIYSTYVEEGSQNPLNDTVQYLVTSGVSNMEHIIENVRNICLSLKRKKKVLDYLNSLFVTTGVQLANGYNGLVSINKLFRGQGTLEQCVDNVLNELNATGKIQDMYMKALVNRLENSTEYKISKPLKELVKGLVPVVVGKSIYTLEEIKTQIDAICLDNENGVLA